MGSWGSRRLVLLVTHIKAELHVEFETGNLHVTQRDHAGDLDVGGRGGVYAVQG
jgi:hypothetical protein